MRVLIAGFGNKFMSDDGFGPRVIEELTKLKLPENVELRDVGLCDVTLAPDLADYDLVIFVDAVKTGGKPGTLYVLEITAGDVETRVGNLTAKLSLHQTGVEEII
ncbi:MAG TPA: hydrogenase maturation protease, partial [Methanomicrobia archaeon]|nr:hydrogenase maturation protease [Methanomicrobia archaeon]HEX58642.1 hydrogenase maturation protease [Methanomicrobia archaeon]